MNKKHTATQAELVHFDLTVNAVGMLHVSAASAFCLCNGGVEPHVSGTTYIIHLLSPYGVHGQETRDTDRTSTDPLVRG